MEGSLTAALGELMNPARQASWTFSNPKSGKLLQHYPIESITWASGSVVANTRFLAIESEGVAGEVLNANQIQNVQDLMAALPLGPWVRKVNAWEHREMVQFGSAPTACPSNRYPWQQIIQEDDMALTPRQEQTLEELAKWTLEPYKVTWPDGREHTFTSKLDFLMAHTTAFDQHRIVWIAGKA
jgi:hypothetical protein